MRDHPQPVPPLTAVAVKPQSLRLVRKADGLTGALAKGTPGDFVLDSGRARVVIRGIGGGELAGAVLDAGDARLREDTLGALTLLLGEGHARTWRPRFTRLYAERAGKTTVLRLVGVDPRRPGLALEHSYSIARGQAALRVVTRLTNRGHRPLTGLWLADSVDWGATTFFMPAAPRWVGGWSPRASYLYQPEEGARLAVERSSRHRAAIVLARAAELAPGASLTHSRHLAIGGPGGLSPLLAASASGRRLPQATVLVRDGKSREPLGDARVVVSEEHPPLPVLEALTGADGLTRLPLAPGRYMVRAWTSGRVTPPRLLVVGARAQRVTLETSPPSQLVFELRSPKKDGANVPGRLVVVGLGETATPPGSLGAVRSASGKGLLPLPPGRYRVLAARGPEHELASEELELPPFRGASLIARPARAYEVRGYRSVAAHELGETLQLIRAGDTPERVEASLTRWLAAIAKKRRLVAAARPGEGSYLRTYVATSAAKEPVDALKRGEAVVTNGALIDLRLGKSGRGPGSTIRLPRPGKTQVKVTVRVLAASWIKLESLTLYIDGKAWGKPLPIPAKAGPGGVRLDKILRLPLAPGESVVAVARGASLRPVIDSPTPAMAITNPVWLSR